jgi:uncharacterized membrane protein
MTTALFAIAALLLSASASLAARHFFTGGALTSAYARLGEIGLHTLSWLACATILAWRFGPRPGALLSWTETLLFASAAVHALFFGLYSLNPWWGAAAAAPEGPHTLLLAYAAPALGFGIYAWLGGSQGRRARANIAAATALALFGVWATLEIRRFFHPADLAGPSVSPSEGWALSLTWLALSMCLAFIAEAAQRRILAAAARAFAVVALVKSAVFDLGALTGLLRVAALLAIGLVCLGILLLRNRFWASFLGGAHMPDPNLTPPR